jgi:hypothetical protein
MKYLVLLLLSLIPLNSFANRVPLSEAQRYIDAAPNGVAGLYTCEDKKDEQCLEFSHIEKWEYAEFIDNYENGKPIYSPRKNETACEAKESCELLRTNLCKEDELFFYAENLILSGYEAYCAKLEGYEQVLNGKKLVNSPTKKAAYEAAIKAKEDVEKVKVLEKETKKNELKETDFSKVSTIAQLKALVQKLIEAQE